MSIIVDLFQRFHDGHTCTQTKYRESPHKTVKWETENTVLCEIVLFQIENRVNAKNSTM